MVKSAFKPGDYEYGRARNLMTKEVMDMKEVAGVILDLGASNSEGENP